MSCLNLLVPSFSIRLFATGPVYVSYIRSGYRTGGDSRAHNTVTFNRPSIQKVVHVNRHGLLPLVSLLTLMFIITLPFTGLSDFSPHLRRRVAVNAGLLQLILMAIVRDPQKRHA